MAHAGTGGDRRRLTLKPPTVVAYQLLRLCNKEAVLLSHVRSCTAIDFFLRKPPVLQQQNSEFQLPCGSFSRYSCFSVIPPCTFAATLPTNAFQYRSLSSQQPELRRNKYNDLDIELPLSNELQKHQVTDLRTADMCKRYITHYSCGHVEISGVVPCARKKADPGAHCAVQDVHTTVAWPWDP